MLPKFCLCVQCENPLHVFYSEPIWVQALKESGPIEIKPLTYSLNAYVIRAFNK